jgi:hypothetical protein
MTAGCYVGTQIGIRGIKERCLERIVSLPTPLGVEAAAILRDKVLCLPQLHFSQCRLQKLRPCSALRKLLQMVTSMCHAGPRQPAVACCAGDA